MNPNKLHNNQPLPPDVQEALNGIDIEAIFNDTFRIAFEQWSTLSKDQIPKFLKLGNGPLVQVKDLETLNSGCQTALEIGKNAVKYNKCGTHLDKNRVGDGGKPGILSIDIEIIEVLKFELGVDPSNLSGLAGKSTTTSDKRRSFKSFPSTLFHEAVQYGRNESGAGNTGGLEAGKEFETAAFGEDVARTKNNSLNTTQDQASDGTDKQE